MLKNPSTGSGRTALKAAELIRTALLLLLAWPGLVQADGELMPLSAFPQSSLTILTADARQHEFHVWLAVDDAHREQGLMGIKVLPARTGMLFVFAHPQPVAMWMKNTHIPLDMLFIDAEGRVQNLIQNATPLSLKILPSRAVVLGVLELPGGTSKALRITTGSIVKHPVFASVPGSR